MFFSLVMISEVNTIEPNLIISHIRDSENENVTQIFPIPLNNQNVMSLNGNMQIEDIFYEINRLQKIDNSFSDDQSIEEILSQAEKLAKQSENAFRLSKSKTWKHSELLKDVTMDDASSKDVKLDDANKVSGIVPAGKDTEKNSTDVSLSKSLNIYDLKQTLKNSGSFNMGSSRNPELIMDDSSESKKLVISLREELKDANERLKSLQLQYGDIVESGRLAKLGYENLSKVKLSLEAKIIERDMILDKMRKEMETLKSFKCQFDANEEKLKQEVAKLKEEKVTLSDQSINDKVTIQDLQRQCKEMEGILAKRHPDSVSALIVASKNSSTELNTKELLEKRIAFLEKEMKEQESKYQNILSSVQDKVTGIKENYETHISDLEKQVVTLQYIIAESKQPEILKETCDVSVQTEGDFPQIQIVKPSVNKSTKQQSSTMAKVVPTNTQARSESHLLATIRGLNTTLSQKEKVIMKMGRDLDESKRHLSKLQKERELNLKALSVEKISNRRPATSRPSSVKVKTQQDNIIKSNDSNKENEVVQEPLISTLKKDFISLQNDYEKLKSKRIADLYALQTAHEKELMALNMKALPLQEDIEKLNTTVEVLKNQTKDMEDQMSLLMTERDHYKHKVEVLFAGNSLNSDFGDSVISSGRRASDRDYNTLKMKVSELEKRNESRELRLKALIDSLAKLKNPPNFTPRLNSGKTDITLPGSYLPF